MRSTYHKFKSTVLTTKECKQIIGKDCSRIVNKQFRDEQHQQMAQKCQESMEEDYVKMNRVKDRLIRNFFTHPKKRNKRLDMLKKFSTVAVFNEDEQLRNNLQRKMKNQLSLVYNRGSSTPKSTYFTRQVSGNSSPLYQSFVRPFSTTPNKQRIDKTPSKKEMFSSIVDNIIEESHKVKKYRGTFQYRRRTFGKDSNPEKKDKQEQCRILDKIIAKDAESIVNNSRDLNIDGTPETSRAKQEENKRKRLSNFEKYNMTFNKFVKQKTHRNIERSIYYDKIRQKDSYVQKFQKYILDQYKFSDEGRQKLERIFEGIQSQYKGHLKKNKQRAMSVFK